jgi:hypothetical protein
MASMTGLRVCLGFAGLRSDDDELRGMSKELAELAVVDADALIAELGKEK